MSEFDSIKDINTDREELAKQVLGDINREVKSVLERIANNVRPYFAENLELIPVTEPGSNRLQPIEVRREAMAINHLALNALYRQHQIDQARTLLRVRFASSVLDQRPMSVYGVPAIGYTDNGQVYVDIEQYGEQGVGFVENYAYSLKENPAALLIGKKNEAAILASHLVTGSEPAGELGLPQKFNFSVYKIEQGGMPLQFLD